MSYFITTISHNTTGVKTITVGFQPLAAHITVGQKTSTAQTMAHLSKGITDGTNQICDTFFADGTRAKTERFSDRLVSHIEHNGTNYVEKVRADFDSFTATELKYNVVTPDVNYQFLIEVWG